MDPDPDVPADPESDLALEARAVRWAIDALLYGDAVHMDELTGRENVTPPLARIAAEYVDVVRNWTARKDPHGLNLDMSDGRVAAIDIGYTIREPGEDPRHLYAAVTAWPAYDRDVTFVIYQPRPWHPDGKWREITRTAADLSAWSTWFDQRRREIDEENPTRRPGEQCGRCLLRSRCPSLAAANYADSDLVASRRPGRKLTPWELSVELDFLTAAAKRLEARKSGLEAEATARLKAGEFVPWYHRADTFGRREFTVGPAAVELLTGVKPMKEVRKTPAEIENEGADKAVVKLITRRKAGGIALQRLSTKDVERMFPK